MKLQRISLCDFRAFPGPAKYEFHFGGCNHLLIYGENGSGKTSVFRALVEFFDANATATPFVDLKNFFSDSAHGAPLDCGRVELEFEVPPVPPGTQATRSVHAWTQPTATVAEIKPSTDPNIQQLNRRKGLLDYQSLLRANLSELDAYGRRKRPNLFRLMVTEMLSELEIVQPGGTIRTLGELWLDFSRVTSQNQYYRGDARARVESAAATFNDSMTRAMVALKSRADGLLSTFFGHEVVLSFVYTNSTVHWHRKPGARLVKDGELWFTLTFKGRGLDHYDSVLNEAKQSAVALCVYFAALLDGKPKGVAGYPRLLVLDDVLIGLDMQNRLPVLRILKKEFADDGWQIILLTHDRVWYDYAAHEAFGIKWTCHELFADRSPLAGGTWLDVPLLRTPQQGAGDYLQRARQHMLEHDHKAAAMYARAAYESALRKYCETRHPKMPFYDDSHKIKSNQFLIEVEQDIKDSNRKVNGVVSPVPPGDLAAATAVFSDVRLNRQQVLNPMSHAHSVSLTVPEVQAAIDSVQSLLDALLSIRK